MTEDKVPNKITGPAIVKIFAPTPNIYPSVFDSKAGADTAFENPVTGTSVPAPPCFAILGYIFRPVSNAPKKIMVMVTRVEAVSLSAPRYLYRFKKI